MWLSCEEESIVNLITKLDTYSSLFCALSINSNSSLILLLCAYFPTNYGTSQSADLYRETLAEIRGFLDSCQYDNVIIAGDFNVDFNHPSNSPVYLQSFTSELNLCAVDLNSSHINTPMNEIMVQLDLGWTISHFANRFSEVQCIHSSCNFSDNSPLCFNTFLSHDTI